MRESGEERKKILFHKFLKSHEIHCLDLLFLMDIIINL